jgi:hypothetical protein
MLDLKPGYRVICELRPDVLQLIKRYEYAGIFRWQCRGQVGVITSCDESDIIRVVETDPDAYWKRFKYSYEGVQG